MKHGIFAPPREITQQRMKLLCRYLLRNDGAPVTAAELSGPLQLPGSRETRRRHVRSLVARLHEDGFQVCADCHPTEGGYWLAKDDGEWTRYLATRRAKTRFRFVRDRKMSEAATDRSSGQSTLFEQPIGGSKREWATA